MPNSCVRLAPGVECQRCLATCWPILSIDSRNYPKQGFPAPPADRVQGRALCGGAPCPTWTLALPRRGCRKLASQASRQSLARALRNLAKPRAALGSHARPHEASRSPTMRRPPGWRSPAKALRGLAKPSRPARRVGDGLARPCARPGAPCLAKPRAVPRSPARPRSSATRRVGEGAQNSEANTGVVFLAAVLRHLEILPEH